MPLTIPYDHTLDLGSVIDKERIQNIEKIALASAPSNAAEQRYIQSESALRELEIMANSSDSMSDELYESIAELGKHRDITRDDYFRKKLKSIYKISKIPLPSVASDIESPIDFIRSKLVMRPLSSDSLDMNVRYISLEENGQDTEAHLKAISTQVQHSMDVIFGAAISAEIAYSSRSQASQTMEQHSIVGTTIISLTATHKNVRMFAPLILSPDKLVRAWNHIYPEEMIDTHDPGHLEKLAKYSVQDKMMHVISSMSYGSSFVGMVHHKKEVSTETIQDIVNSLTSAKTQYQVGGFIAQQTGSIGVDSQFADSARSLMSRHKENVFCNVVTKGVIPTITASRLTTVLKALATTPDTDMDLLTTAQGEAADAMSVASSSRSAVDESALVDVSSKRIGNAMAAITELDAKENSVLDQNSLMTSLDSFMSRVTEESEEHVGIPIELGLKSISKSDVTRHWLKTYYPSKNNTIGSLDDGESNEEYDEEYDEG